ncbi:MAG TPA: hypothetical protein VGZ26_01135 [Pirellulales bacterium]|jgi:hypothetical protein|nr:hypothetical protein [Pirellulales bacterium]
MFYLHETTRIRICRAAFVALCVLPTCAVLAWCVSVRLPGYRLAHERLIAAQLGLRVQLTKASSPRPDMMLYEGLELSDPETGQALARLPFVEVQTGDTKVVVKLPFPAIVNGQRLDAFWKLAHELLRQPRSWRQVTLEAGNLTLHLADRDQSFTDLHAEIRSDEDEGRLTFAFRPAIAGEKPATTADFRLSRNHDEKRPTGACRFSTGGPLPCNLVAGVWPISRHLGKASTFQGQIAANLRGEAWEAELSGSLNEIDLNTLMGQFRHKLTGTARAQLDRVVIQQGRIEAADGKLEAGPGTVSGSLIYAALTHLGFQAAPEVLANRDPLFNYEQLSMAFEIGPQGLAVHGTLPQSPGAILMDGQHILVSEPRFAAQNVVNLARTLVPNSDLQAPATRETGELINHLPVPSIATRESEEPLPKARVLGLGPQRR